MPLNTGPPEIPALLLKKIYFVLPMLPGGLILGEIHAG
jgi:hypothetical protein